MGYNHEKDALVHPTLRDVRFTVGDWEVDPRLNTILLQEQTVHIEPKPMQVLVFLAERAGEPVPREVLLDAIWPDVYVTENVLNRCVSQLRKVFGDNARNPTFISTIPKVGYRLVAPVTPLYRGDGQIYTPDLAAIELQVTPPPSVVIRTQHQRLRMTAWAIGGILIAGIVGFLAAQHQATIPHVAPVHPLTLERGIEHDPSLSPDGTRVVYVKPEDGRRTLYLKAFNEGTPQPLTRDSASYHAPAWSPTGQHIAYVRCDDAGCGVYSMSATGQHVQRLTDASVGANGLAWSPDGTSLALTMCATWPSPCQLALLHLSTQALDTLTVPPLTTQGDGRPLFSRDGNWIIFTRAHVTNGVDLYRVHVHTYHEEQITFDDVGIAGVTWLPDGETLLYSSHRAGLFGLWQLKPGTSSAPTLWPYVAARDPGNPTMLPSGRFVFEEWLYEVNLWRSRGPQHNRLLIASTLTDHQPHLSADAQHLAFISNRTGSAEVWTASVDGANVQQHTFFKDRAAAAPRWSPDGKRLAFHVYEAGAATLYTLSLANGHVLQVQGTTLHAQSPRWSADGSGLFYTALEEGTWNLRHINLTDATDRLIRQHALTAEPAFDGSALYIVEYGKNGLWMLREGQREPEQTPVPLWGYDSNLWAVVTDGIVYWNRAHQNFHFWDQTTKHSVPLDAQPARTLPPNASFTISSDLQTLIVTQTDQSESDLMWTDVIY